MAWAAKTATGPGQHVAAENGDIDATEMQLSEFRKAMILTKDKSAIICASHGATYEIETGYCFTGPGSGRTLKKVDVAVRDGVVYVTGPQSM